MRRENVALVVPLVLLTVAGCSIPLAPGAEQVKITSNAADVAACTAVGNLNNSGGDVSVARNQAIGLGGNTIFDTTLPHFPFYPEMVRTGVIYRCGNAASDLAR
jgi:hypothetical protein